MPETERSPEDGPFFRAAHRHADEADQARSPADRRRAWTRLVPSALAAFIEGLLREFIAIVAVLSCVGAVFVGADAGAVGWTVALVVAGIAGAVLVFIAMLRRWSFGLQWGVYVGVLLINGGLIALAERMTG